MDGEPFKPKRKKYGGRKKGTPNKTTAVLKDLILGALDEVGGQEYFVTLAKEQPVAFCGLLGKILPTQVNMQSGKDIQIVIQRPNDNCPNSSTG